MDNDDQPIGRLLTRREMLKLLAVMGAAAATGCAPRLGGSASTTSATAVPTAAEISSKATTLPTEPVAASATSSMPASATAMPVPACVVRPAQTEGPFFVDEMLNRSDIRSDPSDGSIRPGLPLALTFLVARVGSTCEPLPGAMVDIWHCDADGVYSGVNDARSGSTAGRQFLRGYQLTDEAGRAAFTTIYPGWYPGRTVHIHFKIRTEEGGRNFDFTSQLYFDDALTDQVFTREPYAARGPRNTRNPDDGLFANGGAQLTLNVLPAADGYAATFDIGLQMG